jgi:hypothetical protein
VKFKNFVSELTQYALSASLVLGLILGILVLVTGGAEGSITLDIDFSAIDSIWFILGTPVLLTAIFLLISPLAYCVHLGAFRKGAKSPSTGSSGSRPHE